MYIIGGGEFLCRMASEVALSVQGECILVLMELPVLPFQVPSGQQLGLYQICPSLHTSQGKIWEYSGKKTGLSEPWR